MSETQHNPPAFPRDEPLHGSDGMSLRDYFAAHAPDVDNTTLCETMPGFPEHSDYKRSFFDVERQRRDWLRDARIKWRWIYADAMLAARAKTESR